MFPVRFLAAVAVCVGSEIFSYFISFNGMFWLHSLYNIGVFLLFSLTMWLSFKENYTVVLFCCIAGKCTMHVAEYVSAMIFLAIGNAITYVSIAVSAVVYLGAYFLFARRIKSEDCLMLNNTKLIVYGLAAVCVTDVITMDFAEIAAQTAVKVIVYLLIIIVCFTLLCLQFNLLTESKMKRMEEGVRQLRVKEREQYEISSEAIKLIGIKHHDLKNMLELHRGKFSDEEIDAINKSIDVYNISFHTGNQTLDVILTEKYIMCRQLNIRLETLVNGGGLHFISDMDIYSLYLNALNNAIESVQGLSDESKRVIWLKTFVRDEIVFIKVQNYCEKEPVVIHDNSIETTKEDKKHHGFGLQSMKMVTQKYGGSLSVKVKNNMFNLGIVLPMPSQKETENGEKR